MFDVGRICVKIAGRDAGKECIIVDVMDNGMVLIDGGVRRRKCNTRHLEPTPETADIKKGASHEDVKKAFEKLGFTVWDTKPKNAAARPRQVRKTKEKSEPKKKPKSAKKEEKAGKDKSSAKKPEQPKQEKPTASSPEDLKKELGGQ